MYISAREREIIELLLNNTISIDEIAFNLNISSRTVRRQLALVEEKLEIYNIKIKKISTKGLYIDADEKYLAKLKIDLLKSNELTEKERKNALIYILIEEVEPIKLKYLAYRLNVTDAAIKNDLNKIESFLINFDIKLLRKKAVGIVLEGEEIQKRKALINMEMSNLNEYEFIKFLENDDTNIKIKYVEPKIIKIIKKIVNSKSLNLCDSDYIRLYVYLAISVQRVKKSKFINIHENSIKRIKQYKEFKTINLICKEIEEIFNIKVSEDEKYYIAMYIKGSRAGVLDSGWEDDISDKIIKCSKNLINYVSDKLLINFEEDLNLLKSLLSHIEPAIYNIKSSFKTDDSLENSVKITYPKMFKIIEEGLYNCFKFTKFTKEEVAYIVLHFASSKKLYSESKNITVLLICSSGIGSSKILQHRINAELPQIKNIKAVSLFELFEIEAKEYDIILSTLKLKGFEHEYVIVSPLLTKEDIGVIFTKIQNEKYLKEERLLNI
jgi:mannitol operon transcriptional antiterminator